MFNCFKLRAADQKTVAVLLAVAAVCLFWHTAIGKQETLTPKKYRFRIDLNAATPAELQTLPGIGPKLAGGIIQYRDQHYPMSHYGDLLNVKGIGPKRYTALKPYFTD